MTSLAQLTEQMAALQRQIAEIEAQKKELMQAERAQAVAQIRALMAEHGLTVADVSTGRQAVKKPSTTLGTKAPIKFRNPVTGETWSGRGLKPKWLMAKIQEGQKVEDFAV